MRHLIVASFEIATIENPDVHIIPFPSVMASDGFPNKTRKLDCPHHIPLSDESRIVPDWHPFVLEHDGQYRFILGIEADCNSEPIDTADGERASIRKKFTDYLTVVERRIHTEHFGANSCLILLVTMSELRKAMQRTVTEARRRIDARKEK